MKTYQVKTRDGRFLQVVEAGDPDGLTVIVHHGTPGAGILYAPHIADAVGRHIRLISYSRPGYGGSTRHAGRKVADAAWDVEDILNALKIDRCATWGISGGGPHALACAALLPGRVVAAAALASVAPYGARDLDFLAGMGEDNIEEFSAALQGPDATKADLKQRAQALSHLDLPTLLKSMRSLLSGVDQRTLTGDFGAYLLESFRTVKTHGIDGWLDDDLAFVKPWGFDVSEISIPVQIWQGKEDRFVPFSHGQWLHQHIVSAEPHLSAEDGHLTLLAYRVPLVHEWFRHHF
ncbi:alpha/beta fold hydrolase [Sulfobacillus thermosulfidooxidans]|uniref:alpha/beta fold hydrolase n=1 Tax=Sulfobacillus thermosulfidooxidans TaxID=28034 RepID=UPI0006B4C3F4|nr:alpha/beta hydrolase [Sulfobacillus thermosulfidooxidans]